MPDAPPMTVSGVLRSRWTTIAAATIMPVGVVLGAAMALAPPDYLAAATVAVTPAGAPAGIVRPLTPDPAGVPPAMVRTLVEVARSRAIAARAQLAAGATVPEIHARPVGGADLIRIEATAPSPQAAAAAADAVAETLVAWQREARAAQASAVRQFIHGEVQAMARELRLAEARWVAHRVRGAEELQLARLVRDVRVAEEAYLRLFQQLQDARIAEASIVGDLRLVDRATPPLSPLPPRPPVHALAVALAGAAIGAGVGTLVTALDVALARWRRAVPAPDAHTGAWGPVFRGALLRWAGVNRT
jgi:uncharacterized protein involved in exopolysaccharide biosynthesis